MGANLDMNYEYPEVMGPNEPCNQGTNWPNKTIRHTLLVRKARLEAAQSSKSLPISIFPFPFSFAGSTIKSSDLAIPSKEGKNNRETGIRSQPK
jgi:hypothetical protein